MSRHTPGPWEACIQDEESGDKWFDISSAHGSIAHGSELTRPDENLRSFRSDARLIASAPELLQLLKKAMQHLDAGAFSECEKLIAKIEGETL